MDRRKDASRGLESVDTRVLMERVRDADEKMLLGGGSMRVLEPVLLKDGREH